MSDQAAIPTPDAAPLAPVGQEAVPSLNDFAARAATTEPEVNIERESLLFNEDEDTMWALASEMTEEEARQTCADLMCQRLEETKAVKVWVRPLSEQECKERGVEPGWHDECESNHPDAAAYWRVWPADYDWIWVDDER